MPRNRAALAPLRRLFTVALLLCLMPAPAPARAAFGFDVVPLVLPPWVDVRPDFDPRFTVIDHNGTLYMGTSRLDGSARGVYRMLGAGVEPLLIKDQQVLVQQLSGITTLLTIDQVLPVAVDSVGRVYFQNNAQTTPPGGVSHLLRQELGGGFTLLDTQGPTSGAGNINYIGSVLSDGRWLRQSWERDSGSEIFTYSLTNGTTSQQILRRPQRITTCEAGTKSTDDAMGLVSNAEGKSIIGQYLSTETYQRSDCTGRRLSGVSTPQLAIVGGGVHVTVGSADSNTQHTLGTYQLNDAGHILHATEERSFDPATSTSTTTFRLFKDNQLVHTLSVSNDPDERIESSFNAAQLLPDGSVLYSTPPGLPGQPWAGGLFRDGQLVIAGNDPLFAQPVVFGRLGQVNSRGEVIAFWRSAANSNLFGWVLLSKATGRWTNTNGGAWSDATNWAGEEVPGQGASALFNLANDYTVSTGARQVGSVEVQDGEVTWTAGELAIIGELRVGALAGQGTTNLSIRDRVQAGELLVGALPTSATDDETNATVQVLPDGQLDVSGPLVIGQAGRAGLGLFGGTLSAGETKLGVGGVGTFNTLVGGQWSSGGLLVGEAYPGFVNLGGGVSVQSTAARIGGAPFSPNFDLSEPGSEIEALSRVSIGGSGIDEAGNLSDPSSWSVAQDLELGSGHPGRLIIAGGGSAQVGGSVMVDDVATAAAASSRILVSGVEDETQTPATLLINQDILLGNAAGAESELRVSAGGIVDVGRTLSAGHQPGSYAGVFVVGAGATLTAGQAAGSSCTIGFSGGGELVVRDGGTFRCGAPLFVGLGDDDAYLTVTSASSLVRAQRIEVGAPASADPQATGTLTLNGGRITADQTLTIWENGTLEGSGEVAGLLVNHGTIDVGLEPLGPDGDVQAPAGFGAQPGTLAIAGAATFAPGSRLRLDLVGPGQYDRLSVSGAARLDGELVLAFSEGFAPRAGDSFAFVGAGSSAGAFTSVIVTGLAPGWQFSLSSSGGVTTLRSESDGVAATTPTLGRVYLPLLHR